ncbi:MAG: class I SAM-dependent methyltransferase [Phycisphaerales bacterium]
MRRPPSRIYDRAFFEHHSATVEQSATSVLGRLFEVYRPESILDVGCGRGIWLAAAARLGVRRLHGCDGRWAADAGLASEAIGFSAIDLDRESPEGLGTFDLALCLEVAEHLAPERADPLVTALCAAAPVVLFSAAIPGQGGTGHRHERWPSYWIERFAERGYRCIDALRPHLWYDESVAPYYRQNLLLFVARERADGDLAPLRALERAIPDLVHPVYFARKARLHDRAQEPSLRFCLWVFRTWVRQRLWGRSAERHDHGRPDTSPASFP